MRKLKRDFFEKRQNRPSGIRFTGVPPPSTMYKNSTNIERTLVRWTKIKTRTFPKYVKIEVPPKYKGKKTSKESLRNTFIRGTPYNAYKNQQQKNTKGKIDPQKYVLQGSPLNKKE